MHRSPCSTSTGRTRSSPLPSAPRSSACCSNEPTEIFHSLDSLHPLLVRNGPRQFAFDFEELADVLERATGVFAAESSLLEVPVPCVVYGDLHGQYSDLHR
ncbi:Metallophos domain-containing protein [Aphelenchoides fujianensis]|nr:Metallophos domain-containing protein [Aphelenchoides fujianensis]